MAPERAEGRVRRGLRKLKLGAVSALVVLLVIVLFQNDETVRVHVLFWDPRISRSLLVLATFAAGTVAGLLGAHLLWRRR